MIKLLIVDDESLLRQGFIHMTDWPAHGFQIVGESANGKEALEIIAKKSPDIVVTDIKMPVMDGIELTKLIKRDYPFIQIIILSSYDDFDYVRETLCLGALDYVLKPKMNSTDLLKVLQKASSLQDGMKNTNKSDTYHAELRNNFLTDLLLEPRLNLADIQANFSQYNIPLKESNLTMLAIVYRAIDPVQKSEACPSLIATINAAIGLSFHPVSFFYDSNVSITILNPPVSEDEPSMEELCSKIISAIHSAFSINCQILLSERFDGYPLIREVFQDLLEKVSHCFYLPLNQFAKVSSFQKIIHSIEFDFQTLHTLVEQFDFSKLKVVVENWVADQISQGKYIEPYFLKKIFSEVCYLIIYKFLEMGFDLEKMNQKKFEYLKNMENSKDYGELVFTFDKILADLEQFLDQHIQTKNNLIVTRVLKYLHQNFDQTISLESVSKFFYIDKSYLCKLFKKHTAENFNDYLMKLRINRAKELLKNPEYNVSIVSTKVGYTDYSYFGQVFKKTVGMTPSEYRKSLINNTKVNLPTV